MKKINIIRLFGLLVCCLASQIIWAQSPLIDKISVESNEALLKTNGETPQSFLMEVTGPNEYYFQQEMDNVSDLRIAPVQADGTAFTDGIYRIQLTPTYRLTAQQQSDLIALRDKGDQAGILAYREQHNLPTEAQGFAVSFGVRNGKFVSPNKHEGDLPPPTMYGKQTDFRSPAATYASLNYFETNLPTRAMDNSLMAEDDQVFIDDVIVDGSLCVGQDCVNGENFGFDTQRIKENNLRIHFDDTSASASFPSNDWRIAINDSSNGGANYFAVEDATAGTTPFRVAAGAGNNAIYVSSSGGNVGMGTASPVVELHVTDGDSPTMRLEQNGSNGWTPQTWDVAGNETNFFVRDVTNGSKLPFKIRPGAPDNSLYVAANGDIGLGTANPSERLHVKSGSVRVENGDVTLDAGNLGINKTPTVALDVLGVSKFEGTTIFTGDVSYILTTGVSFLGSGFMTPLRVDAINNRVGIGTAAPGHLLELGTDDAVKPGGGSWSAPSDRRLKTNINDFNDGLEKILQVRPVTFNYNGKLDYPTDKEFIGVIAQEMQVIAPYTIKDLNHDREEENYLAFDPASLTYLLINAVQEQQVMIDAQKEEIEKLQSTLASYSELQSQVDALTRMVSALNNTDESSDTAIEEVIGDKE